MLQHEFEDLIGRKVEREEYIKANALYNILGIEIFHLRIRVKLIEI